MTKQQFAGEQIIAFLVEGEAGMKLRDEARKNLNACAVQLSENTMDFQFRSEMIC